MLKQIGVRLEEELIKKVKLEALNNGTSIQSILTDALISYFDNKITIKQDNMITKPTVDTKPKLTVEVPKPKAYVSPFDQAFDTFIQQEEDTHHSDMLDSILNEEPDPMDEKYFYILRKTFATDLPEDDDATYNNGAVYWTVPKDCCVHRDIHNEPIPFRYSLPNDVVIQPTQSQLAELKKIYGKPVTVEQ